VVRCWRDPVEIAAELRFLAHHPLLAFKTDFWWYVAAMEYLVPRYVAHKAGAAYRDTRHWLRESSRRAALAASRLAGWWAVVYDVTQCYGGPEEGGWWYDAWEPVERRWFLTCRGAEALAAEWRKTRKSRPRYHWRGGDPELNGDEVDVSGNVRIKVQRGWPTSGDNWSRWE
jgi:hypothetical protein